MLCALHSNGQLCAGEKRRFVSFFVFVFFRPWELHSTCVQSRRREGTLSLADLICDLRWKNDNRRMKRVTSGPDLSSISSVPCSVSRRQSCSAPSASARKPIYAVTNQSNPINWQLFGKTTTNGLGLDPCWIFRKTYLQFFEKIHFGETVWYELEEGSSSSNLVCLSVWLTVCWSVCLPESLITEAHCCQTRKLTALHITI